MTKSNFKSYYVKGDKRVEFRGEKAIAQLIRDIQTSDEKPSKSLRQNYPNIVRGIKLIKEGKKFSDDLSEQDRTALEQLIVKDDVEMYDRLIEERQSDLPAPTRAGLRGGRVTELTKRFEGAGAGMEEPRTSPASGRRPPAESKLTAAELAETVEKQKQVELEKRASEEMGRMKTMSY